MSDSFFISPESQNRPYLTAGEYGPGRAHDADVELKDFTAPCEPGEGPGYDRDCKKDTYVKFRFLVRSEEHGFVTHDEWQTTSSGSGSKAFPWLATLGLVDDSGNVDIANAPGTKCGLEFGDPREDRRDGYEGIMYTGRLLSVFAI